jgi:glutamate racemase
MDTRPIGIFDSGVGGLTVAKEIYARFPHLSTVYVGDTARVPYGNRSQDAIIAFSSQIIDFLLTQSVKAIIIACSTSSALALAALKQKYDLPIYGVLEPAAISACIQTKNKKVGVIGTRATIQSQQFSQIINSVDSNISIATKACPLFVPLIEEGMTEGEIPISIAHYYLDSFKKEHIDTLIMGCTHYPILQPIISSVLGRNIELINPGIALCESLTKDPLFSTNAVNQQSSHKWFVTDNPDQFSLVARTFMNSASAINTQKITLF